MITQDVTTKKGCSTEMGLAASQARFLGLTARKNNVEYEGQQINQQRTTLANQSANYYNDLLGMSVPVPPSVDDYTKTIYTFNDGALTNEITAMIAKNDGTCTISYLRQWRDDYSVVAATTNIVNNATGNYMVGKDTLRKLGGTTVPSVSSSAPGGGSSAFSTNGWSLSNGAALTFVAQQTDPSGYDVYEFSASGDSNSYCYIIDPAGTNTGWYTVVEDSANPGYYNYNPMADPPVQSQTTSSPLQQMNIFAGTGGSYDIENDEYLRTLSQDELNALYAEEQEYLSLLQEKYGPGDYLVRYIKNTTTEEWEPYFYKESDVAGAYYDTSGTGNSLSSINCYKVGTEVKTDEVKAVENCKIEKDSTGRLINLSIPISGSTNYTTYALTTTVVTDQRAYDDAMNQYEYEKYQYDQAIQEINAKIEIIQAEDRTLELRLKQLDTEQEAIQTEMDAVSGVIQKNTESSFKTFG